ncbi:lamin tail domain-containing protein [Streptomyces himalayensis]|uniref:Lamin tail domain-containing protein n=1 Tax=Streptomyces himalayensis subsp. himalayensis TaxID=2756131 RepID=A0A7W0DMP6_9ACTN|nr:lamin tail domain-containing protein [Streptomyces himalayensis subsp. himalayensis]
MSASVIARRFTAAALAAGCLLGAATVSAAADDDPGRHHRAPHSSDDRGRDHRSPFPSDDRGRDHRPPFSSDDRGRDHRTPFPSDDRPGRHHWGPFPSDDRPGRHHTPNYSSVVISNVRADSPGFDDGSNWSLNGEWVEIANTSRRSVNLNGWTLRNEDGTRYRFGYLRLEARSTIRVHTGVGRDTRYDVYQDRRHYVWDNRSDTAALYDDAGRLVDITSWGRHR